MATCPNKSLSEWKELVASKGEDMAYYLWDLYKGDIPVQVLDATAPFVAPLDTMKEAAKKMGIRFNTLTEYAKTHPEIDVTDVNALSDLLQGVIAIAEGKEEAVLTEEVVHVATAILEQTNPNIITSLIKQINKYQIYQDTLKQYKNKKEYQTSDGKPNIRKIKKEALDKLLAEVIVRGEPDLSAYPELAYAENMTWLQQAWDSIKQAIRSLVKKSDVNLFQQVAADISLGNVGGTVADISSEEVFFQLKETNEAVDGFFKTLLEVDGNLEEIPEVRNAKGEVVEKRHYKYKGKRIDQSVTEKISKNKDFKDVPDSVDKMKWGTEGHDYIDSYIKLNLLDTNGYKRSTPGTQRISTSLNGPTKVAIESFAQELINSYKPGTRFITEVKVVNTDVKGGLASKIDFMALIPIEDKNGNPDVKIDILDWKFTSFDANNYTDLSHGKQKSWKMQMGEYVKMMRTTTYKIPSKNIGKARMIPFIADYSYALPGVPNSGLVLNKIEVGKINNPNERRLYLLPVPTDEESTGNKEIDVLIDGLEKQKAKMFKKLRNVKERSEKDAEMASIQAAIKRLRVQLDFDPLYSVGRDLTNRISKSLGEYKSIDFSTLSKQDLDNKLAELIDYQASLEKFTNLREVYNNYLSKDDDKLTSEERSTLAKINNVANKASDLTQDITDIQRNFVIDRLVEVGEVTEDNKEEALNAEIAVDDMSYNFMEGSRLPAKIIRMASNMILNAASLVNLKIDKRVKNFGNILNDLEKQANSLGVKTFSLIGEVKDNDLQLINKINKEYYKEQKEAIENKNKKFFIDNMNQETYRQNVAKIIKERNAIIDETIYTTDVNDNLRRREFEKKSLNNKINIFSKDFYGYNNGYFLYIYKQNFLEEKHYSEKFKQLKSNETAYKVWKYFMDLNAEARDLGYLDREKQSFFPLVEATSIQKLQQTKNYSGQALDFFKDVYMSRINENMEYNSVDPETGEVKKTIPKFFTRTDKKVEQLSLDLNLVGSLWIKSIENYKNAKELEHTMHTMHLVESSKGTIAQDGGRTVYNGSNIVTKKENNNAKLLGKIIDDYIYSKKESSTSLGTKAIDIGVGKFAKTEEQGERMGVNVKKTINSANDLVRLLALGAKLPLGIANWAGTQFQSFIKSGKFYKFRDYELAHAKVTFSDIGTLSLEEKGMIDLFVPLNDDTALEARRKVAKEKGLVKYLSTWSFTDVMMLTMQFPEKKLQFANAVAMLNNTIVIDGKIHNVRQYVRVQDRLARKNGATESERKELRRSQEDRIKDLLEQHGIKNTITVTDEGVSIPGVTDEEIAKYRTLIIDYNRTLNGMMDENDKMGFRRDTLFSSFMMFKSWIPKLVYVRAGKLEKNLQTGEWDYGRMRAFLKTVLYKDMGNTDLEKEKSRAFLTRWNMNIFASTKRLKDILYMTDDGIKVMNNILYEKKLKYFRETGQQLEITEEEFQDVLREAVIGQFKELGVLMAVMTTYIGASVAEPPEDATDFEKNRYKWIFRQINKISDEITFYYQPASTEAMMQGTFIPAIGLISKVERFGSQLSSEVWGEITDDQDMVKDSHPTKYFFNLIPVLSQGINEYLPYISPETAKDLGVRVTKEARR